MRAALTMSSDLGTLFLADHPVTGGYPVIGVLTSHSADRISQLLPGTPVRLHRARGVGD